MNIFRLHRSRSTIFFYFLSNYILVNKNTQIYLKHRRALIHRRTTNFCTNPSNDFKIFFLQQIAVHFIYKKCLIIHNWITNWFLFLLKLLNFSRKSFSNFSLAYFFFLRVSLNLCFVYSRRLLLDIKNKLSKRGRWFYFFWEIGLGRK